MLETVLSMQLGRNEQNKSFASKPRIGFSRGDRFFDGTLVLNWKCFDQRIMQNFPGSGIARHAVRESSQLEERTRIATSSTDARGVTGHN